MAESEARFSKTRLKAVPGLVAKAAQRRKTYRNA